MAELDKKTSALPEVTGASLADTDIFMVVSQGVTSKIKKAELDAVFGGAGGGTVVTPPGEGRTVAGATEYLANNAIYNIRDFGAVGDDVNNDTAAIALAVNAARLNGGGRIFIPLGTYKTNATTIFNIDFSNVEIFGEGRGSIIKLYADGNIDATDKWGIEITGVTSNVFIHDFRITSALAVNTSRQNAIGSPSGQTLRDIHVWNMEIDNTILAISFNGNSGSFRRGTMRNNYVHHIKGGLSGTGYGLHIDNAKEVLVDGNTLDTIGRHSIYQARSSDGSPLNNIISNNRILNHKADNPEGGYRAAISCARSVGVTIEGNYFSGGYDGAIEISHATADPDDYNCSEIAVLNNTFTNRRNLVAYIVIGEQAVPTTVKTSNVKISGNKFDDDASIVQFQPFIILQNGLYVSITDNHFRRINCDTAVTQRAIALGVSTYANSLSHCDFVNVRNNTIIFEGSNLTDVRAINIDAPLSNNNATVNITDNTVVGAAFLDYYDTARTNTTMRVAGNNMPSSSAIADGGFYVGGSAISGTPGGADTQVQYNNGGVFGGAANIQYNDTTGNIGLGGTAPVADTLLYLQAARSGEKIAFIRNTATDGYGVRIQNGDDTKYGLKVSDSADAAFFQLFGRRLLQLGPESSTYLTDLLTYSQTAIHIEGDSTYIQPALVLTDGYARPNGSKVSSMLYMSGGDWGLRLNYNYREPYVAGSSFADTSLPQVMTGIEQNGAFSIAHFKAPDDPAGLYDAAGGKSLIFFVGGLNYANSAREEQVAFAIGNPKRGLDFAVEDGTTDAATGSYTPRLRIKSTAADATNPIWIWVGGSLKQVTVDGSGFLKAV